MVLNKNADRYFDRKDYLHIFGLSIAAIVLILGLYSKFYAIEDYELYLTLSIFVSTIVLWITKPVPYTVSSIFCVVTLYGVGLVDSFSEAASGFSSSLIIFIILLLLVGRAIVNVDLDVWISNRLISPDSTPNSSIRRLGGTVFFLALAMPSSVARAVAFMPVVDEVNESYQLGDKSDFRRFSYYILGHLNMSSSLALMTSGGMAIATGELINEMVEPITWLDWAIYMIPPIIFLYLTCALIASMLFNVDDSTHSQWEVSNDVENNSEPTQSREPLTRDQMYVTTLLTLAITSWIIGSFVGIPTIVPAMIVVFALCLPRVEIITAPDFKHINWAVIFIIGAMLSLIDVMGEVGAIELIINILTIGLPTDVHQSVVILLLLIFATLIRGMFSSVAAAYIILFPVLYNFALVSNINPLYLSFGLAIILISTTFLPFNNPTVLLIYEQGPFTMREVFYLGLLTLCVAFFIVASSWVFYWPFVEGAIGI